MSSIDTCDHCRARKVRCIFPTAVNSEATAESEDAGPSSGRGRCQNCTRRGETCTFDYIFKKPGRPRGSLSKRSVSRTRSQSPIRRAPLPLRLDDVDGNGNRDSQDESGPSFGSIFGSARLALDPPAPAIAFNFSLPFDQNPSTINPASLSSNTDTAPNSSLKTSLPWLPTPPEPQALQPAPVPKPPAELILSNDPHVPFPQISSFATWEQVGFFLSLHMLHQHVLTPLVHQPSFARDLLHRRDVNDEAFRGLLMSIVTYTICQVPIHMLLDRMDRPQLESLCRRCQRASRAIQVRHQMRPNMVTLTSTVFDWITSQAMGQDALRENLMSDVRRLVYSLGLHLPHPPHAVSPIDLEIARRVYWEAYAIDKTNALNGHTIAIPDFEGAPPFPLEVDDEYINTDSAQPQPSGKLSFMSGFIVISRIFQILSQTIMRQRTLRINPSAGPDKQALLLWIESTTAEVRAIMADLPEKLRHDYSSSSGDGTGAHSLYATQQANIQITALCLELCLLDLKAAVTEGEGVVIDRKSIAEKAFRQLSTIPIDCIASNGESMRGKVLRVILALLGEDHSEQFSSELWDWWNMYSQVQFLQIIPEGAHTAPLSPSLGAASLAA